MKRRGSEMGEKITNSKRFFGTYGYPIISVLVLALFLFIDLGYWILLIFLWHIFVTVWHIFKCYFRETDEVVKVFEWIIGLVISISPFFPRMLPKGGERILQWIKDKHILSKCYALLIFLKYNIFGVLHIIAFSLIYCYLYSYRYVKFIVLNDGELSMLEFFIYSSHHYILSSPENISCPAIMINLTNLYLSVFFIFVTVLIISHVLSIAGQKLDLPSDIMGEIKKQDPVLYKRLEEKYKEDDDKS
jgi:hypothetical protein